MKKINHNLLHRSNQNRSVLIAPFVILFLFSLWGCLKRSGFSESCSDSTGTTSDSLPVAQIIAGAKAEKKEVSSSPNSDYYEPIIDASYTFEEAVDGSKAPESIIQQLELFDVEYLSTDGEIHRGQILTHCDIANDIKELFQLMLDEKFVVEKVIPVVRYGWSDSLSMADNNSYSFCYRNISYSQHAKGRAIDINPRFNPLRWKHSNRPNQPTGAVRDTTVNGTFYPNHPIVEAFKEKGFRWGHTFSKYYDDHHFEKKE